MNFHLSLSLNVDPIKSSSCGVYCLFLALIFPRTCRLNGHLVVIRPSWTRLKGDQTSLSWGERGAGKRCSVRTRSIFSCWNVFIGAACFTRLARPDWFTDFKCEAHICLTWLPASFLWKNKTGDFLLWRTWRCVWLRRGTLFLISDAEVETLFRPQSAAMKERRGGGENEENPSSTQSLLY